jgi:hypothetical protein
MTRGWSIPLISWFAEEVERASPSKHTPVTDRTNTTLPTDFIAAGYRKGGLILRVVTKK